MQHIVQISLSLKTVYNIDKFKIFTVLEAINKNCLLELTNTEATF